jgi:uncharacterized membrane protein
MPPMQEVVVMSRQESTSVVGVPLATVESRLSHVEEWPQFLVGLSEVEKVSHGRYLFHVTQGSHSFDVPVAVTTDAHDHRLAWHALEGPKWDGEVKLALVDGHHTRVHLVTVVEPRGFADNVAEMVSAHKDAAKLDLQRLEALVTG